MRNLIYIVELMAIGEFEYLLLAVANSLQDGEPTAERGGRAKRLVKVTAAGSRAAADFYKMISIASRDVQWAEISL